MMLRGFQAIAAGCGVYGVATVRRYASLSRDPLPIVMIGQVPTIDLTILQRWKRRFEAGDNRAAARDLEVVEGIASMASALHTSTRSVLNYANRATDPLPVNGIGTRRPWIWRGALEDWYERQALPYQVARAMKKGNDHGHSLT